MSTETINNKVVTLEGLQDYNKQLRSEIHRLGLGNKIEGDFSYAFGRQNTILCNNVTAIGHDLYLSAVRDPEMPLLIIGRRNELPKTPDQYSNTAFAIGGGTGTKEEDRKDIFNIKYNGSIHGLFTNSSSEFLISSSEKDSNGNPVTVFNIKQDGRIYTKNKLSTITSNEDLVSTQGTLRHALLSCNKSEAYWVNSSEDKTKILKINPSQPNGYICPTTFKFCCPVKQEDDTYDEGLANIQAGGLQTYNILDSETKLVLKTVEITQSLKFPGRPITKDISLSIGANRQESVILESVGGMGIYSITATIGSQPYTLSVINSSVNIDSLGITMRWTTEEINGRDYEVLVFALKSSKLTASFAVTINYFYYLNFSY